MTGEGFTFALDDSQVLQDSDQSRAWFAVPVWDESEFQVEVEFADCAFASSDTTKLSQGGTYYMYVKGSTIDVVRRS